MENKDKQGQLFALKGLKKRLGEESCEIEFASSLEFSNGNRSMYLYTAFKSCFNPNLPTTIKDKSESEIAQLCPALWDPMDCSLPGSSILGIFQARILEWVAISFSRRSSQPRDWTQVSCTVGRCFTIWATSEVQISMQISLSLLPTYLPCSLQQMNIYFGSEYLGYSNAQNWQLLLLNNLYSSDGRQRISKYMLDSVSSMEKNEAGAKE